jgi:hypothetical protein
VAAHIGNWTDEDKTWLAILKLAVAAKALYEGSQELHKPNIMWANFKAAFQILFQNVRTEQ